MPLGTLGACSVPLGVTLLLKIESCFPVKENQPGLTNLFALLDFSIYICREFNLFFIVCIVCVCVCMWSFVVVRS